MQQSHVAGRRRRSRAANYRIGAESMRSADSTNRGNVWIEFNGPPTRPPLRGSDRLGDRNWRVGIARITAVSKQQRAPEGARWSGQKPDPSYRAKLATTTIAEAALREGSGLLVLAALGALVHRRSSLCGTQCLFAHGLGGNR